MRQPRTLSSYIIVPGVVASLATLNCGQLSAPDDGYDATAQQASAGGASVFAVGTGFARRACNEATAPGMAACTALIRTTASGDVIPAFTPSGYGPADLRSAYRIPDDGQHATIAIVDAFDDPNAESDLATYRSTFGLAACTTANGCFRKVNQSGAASPLPPSNSNWATEIALDLDMASAACPTCNILLVEATSSSLANLGAAVDTAVSLGAAVVSNSYGTSEFSSETSFDPHYHHPGVGVFVSSGDSGFGVSYPAASQFVTAVGGTTLNPSSTALRGWSETAWSGAGSGCSAFEPKPAWQHDSGCPRRTVADISAVADPATAVAVFDSFGAGGWALVGGTSAAAPLVAGIYAATGRGASDGGFSYTAAAGLFNDVTSGSNGTCSPAYLCTAGAGFDGPTGNGTPNGARPGGMIVSDTNANLAINAYGGAVPGAYLRLVDNCSKLNPDCTWTYRDGMILSNRDPGLAVNADGGAQNGTALRLANNCTKSNTDCTWTYHKGMFVSDTNPSLVINAYGGAVTGANLNLVDNCSASNSDCTFTQQNAMVISGTDSGLAMNAYGGAVNQAPLKLVNNCAPDTTTCLWTLSKGMVSSAADPTLAMNAFGGAQQGTALQIVNNCDPGNTDCTWTIHQGLWLSDTDPSLAMNAFGGAQHGTALKLADNCATSNRDCLFIRTGYP